jgi:hypothetical protein
MEMRSLLILTVVMGASVMAVAGCGSGGRYPVYGKVLYNGEPAVGANVTFVRTGAVAGSDIQAAQGTVQEDGTFVIAGSAGAGAIPGDYTVLVEWKEGAGKVKGRSPALSAPDRLKNRYMNPNKPLLTATVEAKSNHLPTFELK